ncbi:MAG TPA: hypothetical protein VIL27_00040, partial [Clostridia bacterium]
MKKRGFSMIALLLSLVMILLVVLAVMPPENASAGGMSSTPARALYADQLLTGESVLDVRIDLSDADLAAMLASPLNET